MNKILNGHQKLSLSAMASLAFVLLMMMQTSALAGPDCTKHPDHPSCGGDGGGNHGGGGRGVMTSCAVGFGAGNGCKCNFSLQTKDTTDSTPPSFAYTLLDDCRTDTMLTVPVFGSLLGNGHTLTAIDGFSGEAVVTNEGYRAVIQDLTININSSEANGCDGTLKAGILYTIDGSTTADPQHPAVRLRAANNIIKSESSKSLCRGIEATRTSGLNIIDRFVRINSNQIWANSYAETGILVRGFGPSDDTGSEITASNNNVSQGTGNGATAMRIGPASTDVVSLQKNMLSAAPSGAGLAVLGEEVVPSGGVPLQIEALRNNISGGQFGIVVDGNVAASDVTGNSLTGDPANDGMGDIAVCDDSFYPLDRRNKSTGYDISEGTPPCSAPAP